MPWGGPSPPAWRAVPCVSDETESPITNLVMSVPRTLKLTVSYDGTRFVGWQRQAEGVSVQGLLEDVLARGLNACLPPEVRVTEVQDAPSGFHARFSARSKTYRYVIRNAPVVSPFERAYVW